MKKSFIWGGDRRWDGHSRDPQSREPLLTPRKVKETLNTYTSVLRTIPRSCSQSRSTRKDGKVKTCAQKRLDVLIEEVNRFGIGKQIPPSTRKRWYFKKNNKVGITTRNGDFKVH